MRGSLKGGALLAAICAALLAALSGSASGAVVAGSNLSLPPNSTICVLPGQPTLDCTAVITGLPGTTRAPGGFRAGMDGVVVAWSIRTGPSAVAHSVRLRLVQNDSGVGTGPVETLPPTAGVYTYAARLPVEQNDFIGVDTLDVPEMIGAPIIRSNSAAFIDYWTPSLADGEARAPFANEAANIELLVNATIEPDADGDGFGDETQDKCAGTAGGNQGCPPPKPPEGGGGGSGGGGDTGGGGTEGGSGAGGGSGSTGGGNSGEVPPPPPETTIVKGPKGAIASRRVSFRFTSTGAADSFQCKLDRRPFRSCHSPQAYKGLTDGKHAFKVRAVGPTGLLDQTPAKRTFRIAS